jgi:succinoglycan biosynthesis transport protein ExoP
LKEFTDPSIHNTSTLVNATSFPVLAGIPEIVTQEDKKEKKRKQALIIMGLFICVIAGVVAFHFLVMDLNVFWAKLMRNLGV